MKYSLIINFTRNLEDFGKLKMKKIIRKSQEIAEKFIKTEF